MPEDAIALVLRFSMLRENGMASRVSHAWRLARPPVYNLPEAFRLHWFGHTCTEAELLEAGSDAVLAEESSMSLPRYYGMVQSYELGLALEQ